MRKFLMLLLTLAVSLGCTYATPKVPKKKVQRKKTVLVNVKDRVKNDANVTNPNLPVIIQEGRYGLYYADTTSCNESSTAGMVDWAGERKQLYDKNADVIKKCLRALNPQTSVVSAKNAVPFRKAMNYEARTWKKLEALMRDFGNIAIEVQYVLNGGTILLVVGAGMHSNLSYIRFACLQEDLNTLSGVSVKPAKQGKGLSLGTLYAQMQSLRPVVKAQLLKKKWNLTMAEARKEAQRLSYSYSVSAVKKMMKKWLEARKAVSGLLAEPYRTAYNLHTITTVHSFIEPFMGIEQ